MQWVNAFLLATAFAYFACFVYTCMGKPALVDVNDNVQKVFYGLAFVVFLFVSLNPGYILFELKLFLICYSVA